MYEGNNAKFIEDVKRTESYDFNAIEKRMTLENILELNKLLCQFVDIGNKIDGFKKFFFYGKNSAYYNNTGMTFPISHKNIRNLHAILGIATEGVELIEALQKVLDSQELDSVNLMEESFDVDWYQGILQDNNEYTEDEMRVRGINKLKARFPDKFSSESAINRDLETERKILEGRN